MIYSILKTPGLFETSGALRIKLKIGKYILIDFFIRSTGLKNGA